MADPPIIQTPDSAHNSLRISPPIDLCSPETNSPENRTKPQFISSESKLSLPSNLGTPTSPLRLSSPLSLPTSPTPFIRLMASPQPPPSPKSLGRSRQSSVNKSIDEETKENDTNPVLNTGSATGNPRNKCALQPGHSLMDWIRLGSSGKDLSGVGGRIRPVSPRELATHSTKNDAWLAIRGRVYNITHYLPFHPGGPDELMRGAGTDATQLFDKVHAWVNYDSLLSKCLVGPLCIDRPDAAEVFGPLNPFSKSDRLREPRKAQELVRKSMENLANCITPVKKKGIKGEDSKSSNPSKIMQCLIMSSDLPVSISRKAASSPVRSKSASSDDTPSPLRFDWIQTSSKLTLSIYTGSLANPGGCARLTEGTLLVEIASNDWHRTLKVVPEEKLKGPLQLKVYAESGKVEITVQKQEAALWKGCGTASASAAVRVSGPRSVVCRVIATRHVSHDTALLALSTDAGPVAVPLGFHVRIHCRVKGEECVRSYTPIGDGWSQPDDAPSIKLAVKGYPDGALSRHLTALTVDEVVTMSGPYGNFQLNKLKGVKTIFLIAAGTGITPMLGILKFMLSRSNPRCERSHLLFFNKKEEDILFRENFDEIAKTDARFTATHVLSEGSDSWQGLKGRINKNILIESLGTSAVEGTEPCTHFACLCGPTEFTHTAIELLEEMGMQENCTHAFMG